MAWSVDPRTIDYSAVSADLSDLQVAAVLLQESGSSREEAALALLNDPGASERLAGRIADRRARWSREAEERAAAVYAASPPGRTEAARAALVARQERAALTEAARALLEDEGYPTKGMTDQQVLWAAKIEAKPVERMSLSERDDAHEELAQNWRRMGEEERRSESRRLGLDPARVQRYVEQFVPGGAPASAGEGGESQ